ncbi:MAG: type II toxin-antitoxin system YoeB family toxin [Parachlamydiaceae bacterium]|nr:type II toxin-antitoxin system YoeB family toxin [Parachlamydiaceae bacterium]
MYKNFSSFFLIISIIISFSSSLHAGKNKKTIKQQPKSNIETVIKHNTNNPISDPEEFGFSHLKTWDKLNNRKKQALLNCLNEALKLKNENNIKRAEQLLRENAKKNCDNAMFHLGCLEEEKENFEEAYTWYMLSFCSAVFKKNDLTQQNDAYNKLLSIIDYQQISEDYKIFFKNFTNPEYISDTRISKNKINIITLFITSLQKSSECNPKLSAFAFELCRWADNDGTFYSALGSALKKQNLNEAAAHCYRLSKTDASLTDLIVLIVSKKITTDLNGKNFDADKVSQVEQAKIDIMLKKKNLPPKELEILGESIILQKNLILNGKSIPENKKYEMGVMYLRKAKTPKAFEIIGELITANKIQYDEYNFQISPNKKFDIAARNFRKSGSPQSMINLAALIYNKQITQNENGNIIPEESRYGVVEKIARKYIDLQDSISLIADLIFKNHTDFDESNNKILENQRYETASRLYLKAPTKNSYYKIAILILNDYINTKTGLSMLGYNEEFSITKNEIFAELCKRSGTPEALSELALQIYKNPIDKDEHNNPIDENQRIKKSSDLFKQSSTNEAFFNLAIIKLNHAPIKSIEILKECLSLFEKSFSLGFTKALEWSLSLNEKITALENQDNPFILEENSAEFKEGKELETISENSEKIINSDNTTTSFSIKISEEDTNEHSSEQTNIDEENALSLEVRKKIKAAKKAEKIIKTKDLLKRKQNRFQLINHQLPQNQMNDLLINVKKPQKNYKKNQIKWNKKTLDQINSLLSHEKDKVLLLIDDIKHGGTMGRPETLQGCNAISRRITQEHRLVYRLIENNIEILSCKGHYEDM